MFEVAQGWLEIVGVLEMKILRSRPCRATAASEPTTNPSAKLEQLQRAHHRIERLVVIP